MKKLLLMSGLGLLAMGMAFEAQARCTPGDPFEQGDCRKKPKPVVVEDNSSFVCIYQTKDGTQELNLIGPGHDLSQQVFFEKPIKLRVGTEQGPVLNFTVSGFNTRVGYGVTYSYNDRFFVNDILITYRVHSSSGNTTFDGVMKTDSGDIKLTCEFY